MKGGRISVSEADLADPNHQRAILAMTDAYCRDPYGDAKPLAPDVKARLIPALRDHPATHIFLAFDDTAAVGSAVCFLGFSTFRAMPLLNVHDLMVLPPYRSAGIARRLLDAVEGKARKLGCCKLTLEVMDNNWRALAVYSACGFTRYALRPEAGQAIFLTKPLDRPHAPR